MNNKNLKLSGLSYLLISVCLLSFNLAYAGLDLDSYTCTPNDHLGNLPGSHNRVMAFTYHNGYLIESVHGNGRMNVYDLTSPSDPLLVNAVDLGWAGHHNYIGIGTTLAWNFAGHHQIQLDDAPNFTSASKVDGTDEAFMVPVFGRDGEQLSYYPYGFGSVPHGYGYQKKETITIHDQRLPGNPIVGSINVLAENGFEGRVNMIGNLLIIRGDNEQPHGVATYDISDPANPIKLDSLRMDNDNKIIGKSYDSMPMWGNYVILAQSEDTGVRAVDIVDFSDPSNLMYVTRKDYTGNIRYAQFKDQYMFVGESKVDMSQPGFPQVATYPGAFGEYLLPVGNILVTAGQDRFETARIFCNEASPDTQGPTVAYHNPVAGATGMHVKSRVGLLIHETMDLNTLNSDNFIIRALNGDSVAVDISWMDNDTINITPKSPLEPDTTYEFFMPTGGVKDIAGNPIEDDFSFLFSTGDNLETNRAPVINDVLIEDAITLVNRNVQITVEAIDPDGSQLEYKIDWGDGVTSGWSNSPSFNHTYSSTDIYDAGIEVKDSEDAIKHNVVKIFVHDILTTPHTSSSSIIFDNQNSRLLNVNPDNDSVTVIDAESGNKIFDVNVAKDPRSIALANNGDIWVVSHDDAMVSVLSGANGQIISTIVLHPGSQPFGIVLDSNNQYAYVSAMAEGSIYRIDMATQSVSDTLEVGPSPRALALSNDDNTLLATRFVSAQTEAQVYRIDTALFNSVITIPISIDTTSLDTNTSGRGIPNYLMAIAISPDGTTAWIGSKKDNILRGISRDGNPLTFENSIRSLISFIDLNTNTEIPGSKFDIDNAELVSDILFGPYGKLVYISHQGNNMVSVYNIDTLQVIDRVDVGLAPISMAIDISTNHIYTHNFLSRSVSRVNLFSGFSNSVGGFDSIYESFVVVNDKLSTEQLLGKQTFYDASNPKISRDGYISCAGCHLDGGSDERVWDFTGRGEGLRNTISLRGRAGTAHGRVHWSANFDEIQDFEHDVRNNFGGLGLMSDADFLATDDPLGASKAGRSIEWDAVAVYLVSLNEFEISPYRNASGQLSSDAQIGKDIFDDLGCASCHGGTTYTDSPQGFRHNIGTLSTSSGGRLGGLLSGLDTPTLRGIWQTAPYLHDGSAATIEDVFNDIQHVNTASLSDNERTQLAEYLKQIDGLEAAAEAVESSTYIDSFSSGDTFIGGTIPLSLTTDYRDIIEVVWVVNDIEIFRTTAPPFDYQWQPEDGNHRVYAMITYNNGSVTSFSPELNVNYLNQYPRIRAEAELWVNQFGLELENCNDTSGCGQNIGFADPGDWAEYSVDVPIANYYDISFRVASELPGSSFELNNASNTTLASINVDNTGGWQAWETRTVFHVYLHAGANALFINITGHGVNVNWFELTAPSGTNTDPVASFDFNTINLNASFDASLSSDADGDALTYTWDFGDGSMATGINPSHSYTVGGTYNVILAVSDGKGGSHLVTGNVTVSPGANNPPIAIFNSSVTFLSASFNAFDSIDADGDALTYTWDFGDASTATGISPNHTYAAAGTYNVTVIVDDGNGGTDTTTSSVIVVDPPLGTCTNVKTGGQSGNFNTTGTYCFKTQDSISGWGASNFAGRVVLVTINGVGPVVTVVGVALPVKGASDFYHFEVSAGNYPWASIYWW